MTADKHTLDQAKKWADRVKSFDHGQMEGNAPAAAEVIRDLPDVIVDGDKVREVINAQLDSHPHGTVGHQVAEELACKLQSLLPAPKPRTLADMSPEERVACQWMQADVSLQGETRRVVITRTVDAYESAEVIEPGGFQLSYDWSLVTPLPDLPRMEWPDDQFSDLPESAQETLKASVEDYKAGRFVDIDSAPTPQVEIALGAWAMHPEHGKVLITSTRVDSDGKMRVCKENDDYDTGTVSRWVHPTSLSPVPDTHDDSEEQSEYAPGGVLPERTSAEKDQMHRTLEKLNQQYTEPQPGEAWLILYKGKHYEALFWYSPLYAHWTLTLDREGTITIESGEAETVRRLVPEQQPRQLTTVEDYENAADGTVAHWGPTVIEKKNGAWYSTGSNAWNETDSTMSDHGPCTVLWEPEA